MTEKDLRLLYKRDTGLDADSVPLPCTEHEINDLAEDELDELGEKIDILLTGVISSESLDAINEKFKELRDLEVEIEHPSIELDDVPYVTWLEEQLLKWKLI